MTDAVRRYEYSRAAFLCLTVEQIEPGDPMPPAGHSAADGPPVRVCRHRLASGEERQVEVTTRPIEFGGAGSVPDARGRRDRAEAAEGAVGSRTHDQLRRLLGRANA
jgi:hypothetical protein